MKKRLSLFSIFMALVVLFSCFLVGCTKDGGTSGSGESTSWFTPKGVHDRKVKITNDYLVSNNTTQYKIVVPSDAKDYDLLAAEVINEFMFEAVGVTFPIVTDDVYSNADKESLSLLEPLLLLKRPVFQSTLKNLVNLDIELRQLVMIFIFQVHVYI